ncbi:MAG: hypothetical protein AAB502_11095, partial [Chloroflexota bacterium]
LLQGKPFERAAPAPGTLQAALALLPNQGQARAQVVLRHGGPLDFKKVLADKKDLPYGDQAAELFKEFQRQVLALAEALGNFRIEALSVGLSGDEALERCQWNFVARCQYDQEAARLAAGAAKFPQAKAAGQPCYMLEDQVALWLPSEDRACLTFVPEAGKLSLTEFSENLKQAAGQPKKSLPGEEQQGPGPALWAEIKLNAALQQAVTQAAGQLETLVETAGRRAFRFATEAA